MRRLDPLGLRQADRLFETSLLITEAAVAATVLHGIDWVIARPALAKKIAV